MMRTRLALCGLLMLVPMAAMGEDLKPDLRILPIPEPWRQTPFRDPGSSDARLGEFRWVVDETIALELRRGGSEYRTRDANARSGHVVIRERYGELVSVDVGRGCRVDVISVEEGVAE